MHPDHERYVKACDFPGRLDEVAVEKHLAQYLAALGVKRKIVRLGPGWTLEEYPALEKYANQVLDELKSALDELDVLDARASKTALDARAALDALDEGDARDALASIASHVAREDLDSFEQGVVYLGDDELEESGTAAARAALVVGASMLASDELDAIAARAAHDSVGDSGHFVRSVRAWSAARAVIDARAARTQRANHAGRAIHNALLVTDAHNAGAARAALDERYPLGDVADASRALLASDAAAIRFAPGLLNLHDARTAYHSREALQRFAARCIQSELDHRFDLPFIAERWFGATTNTLRAWSRPLFEAYIEGAWLIHWTEDTLFWVAKPRLFLEPASETTRRLHRADGPAVESDVEDLYFWHGVRVSEFVVTRPEGITLDNIRAEENAEVRRIMIERYGPSRYLLDSKAEVIHQDDFGTLYRAPLEGDEPLVMVRVVNSTPEPDGTHKDYFIRVPSTMKRAREAIAWTFGLREAEYNPEVQT